MKGDIPLVALRLKEVLPVRTHERKPPPPNPKGPRAIRYRDAVYPSVAEAARQLKCSPTTMNKRLQTGKAEYV